QDELTYHPELVLPRIRDGLRAFVGVTAFEELSRQWVTEQGRTGKLPLAVQEVGSHWSRAVQVDVVGINWAERAILLGECKWGTGSIDRAVIREMLESKTPKVLKDLPEEGAGWKVHRAFFARTGFTEAARAEARSAGALLVDLATLDADLRETLVGTEASME
ncbi:MAG TPA: DUF234 domain-containing protein, partial [Anaerolineae bacterium]|nr:DUF234 domain-containing protein [Anaerolineae bacterium]